jgi:hypothetical protein
VSRYEQFDRSRLEIMPLAERNHDLKAEQWLALEEAAPPFEHPDLPTMADRLRKAAGKRHRPHPDDGGALRSSGRSGLNGSLAVGLAGGEAMVSVK